MSTDDIYGASFLSGDDLLSSAGQPSLGELVGYQPQGSGVPPIPPLQPIPILLPPAPTFANGGLGTLTNGTPLNSLDSYQQGLGGLQQATGYDTPPQTDFLGLPKVYGATNAGETPIENSFDTLFSNGSGLNGAPLGANGTASSSGGFLSSLFGKDPLGLAGPASQLTGALQASNQVASALPSTQTIVIIAVLLGVVLLASRA
jgi:hypothetical protein